MLVHTLLTILTSSLLGAAPNLCDDAYLNAAGEPFADSTGRTLSRYCEWTGPEAPTLESNVCSITDESADCKLANLRGYCATGTRMWCERGDVDSSTGRVTCMQAFPSACEAGQCVQAPPDAPQGYHQMLCCTVNGCVAVEIGHTGCEGTYLSCNWGMSLPDGTVECFE